ncbi:MAG: hypothetical protein RI884_2241 [Pseudomonadota bacterium]
MPPSPASTRPSFQAVQPSRISEFEGLVRALTAWCNEAQVPPQTVSRLVLVLDELFTNIVVHGYREDPHGEIVVQAQVRDGAVDVTLTDHAPAFNPLLVPETDTTLSLEARPLGGLGLLFVRNTSDELRYQLLTDAPQAKNWLQFTLKFGAGGNQLRDHALARPR